MNCAEVLHLIRRGTQEVLIEEELEKRLASGRVLRVKAGFDPTAPDLHLGHTVLLTKLRQFQDAGHHALFLIGDFTAVIGDPTGKSATRKAMTREEVVENARTYEQQIFRVLDPDRTEIVFNSTWMDGMRSADLIALASRFTVARMLERDDFGRRYSSGQPISVHEFMYPLIQGYDSVALRADVELGGTDQKFNLLVGRHLQEVYGQSAQTVITLPLLEGVDGQQKMSKSLGNSIGIADAPDEMFGKLMSISDVLMWRYFDLLSFRSSAEIQALKVSIEQGANPRDVKFELAREIVGRFHDAGKARDAMAGFIRRFRDRQLPVDVPELSYRSKSHSVGLAHLLRSLGLVSSSSEALRLIDQGAVRLDGQKVSDRGLELVTGARVLVQVGKHRAANVSLLPDSAID